MTRYFKLMLARLLSSTRNVHFLAEEGQLMVLKFIKRVRARYGCRSISPPTVLESLISGNSLTPLEDLIYGHRRNIRLNLMQSLMISVTHVNIIVLSVYIASTDSGYFGCNSRNFDDRLLISVLQN